MVKEKFIATKKTKKTHNNWKWKEKEERMKQEKWRKIERKEPDREWEEEHVLTVFFIYQSIYWFMFQVFHHNAIQFVVNIRIKFCPFYVSLLTLWRKSTNYLENKKTFQNILVTSHFHLIPVRETFQIFM